MTVPAEIDETGGRPRQRTDAVRCADRRDPAVAHRQRLRGRRVIDDDLAVEENGVGRLGLRDADKCKDNKKDRTGPEDKALHPSAYNRCKVHSVSMNMSFAPGGVRR